MHAIAPCANCRVGRGGEELVHRAALVGFYVTERDPSQLIERDDLRDRVGHEREHRAQSGVEQQWLLGAHDELVEHDAGSGRNVERRKMPSAISSVRVSIIWLPFACVRARPV